MAPADLSKLNETAVENFRQYLRIPSVQPNVNYDECVKFLRKQATELGLEFKIYEVVKSKPIVILTWKGTNPALPSVLLNSHMDVVPVYPEFWKYGPFDAEIDANGNIYARGAQDMKCVAIQYLEAVRRLILKGERLKRNIHLSFVPDEEIGGVDGMKKFVKTQEFKNLNVGFALDEGLASPSPTLLVYNGERTIWHRLWKEVENASFQDKPELKTGSKWLERVFAKEDEKDEIVKQEIEFKCPGSEGHGSLLLENTAGEKMRRLIDRLMDFRQTQVDKLNSNKNLTIGDVTTANLTMTKGGVEPNVIPPDLSVTFDFRLSFDMDEVSFENQIKNWMAEAGDGMEMKYIQKNPRVPPTKVDSSNPFWTAIHNQLEGMNIKYKICTFPGGSDGRYCRELGIPVIGLSPIINTPTLLHAHDEFLNKDVFLRGIDVYQNIIPAVANV